MVHDALHELPMEGVDLLFIENVGNLVCPANYDLGESLRFVLLSTPEGDDKPKKYPEAFLSADVFLLTKMDLLPHLPFDPGRVRREALEINPRLEVFPTSALTGEGIGALADYLVSSLENLRGRGA
jgi:hydrogenase nickel incorporation protein HypB